MLVVPLEIIAIEQRQRTTVGVEHLEDAHARVIGRKVLALLEGDPIQLVGGVKDAVLQHIVQFEIRLDLLLVEIVFGLANLLGVEPPVPRLELEAAIPLIDNGLDILGFAGGPRRRWRHQRVQELQGRFRRLGHLVFDLPGRKIRTAKQLAFLRAKLGNLRDGVTSVVGIAAFGAVPRVRKQGLASCPIAQRHQIGLLRGVLQWNDEAFHIAPFGRLGGSADLCVGQSGQGRFAHRHISAVLGGGEQFCLELVGQGR